MLEIVFGESAEGSLKLAQAYGKGRYQSRIIGVFSAKPGGGTPTLKEMWQAKRDAQTREHIAWEKAVPLGGSPKDVYGLPLCLDIGDISEEAPGSARLAVLQQQFSACVQDIEDQRAEKLMEKIQTILCEIQERIYHGEAARVWYSDRPDERCGFAWFLAQANNWDSHTEIYAVKMPSWTKVDENTYKSANGWGEVNPEEWHTYTELQQKLPPEIILAEAMRWRQLQTENAPLRAVVNGQLCSVPEDFYDSFIRRELAGMDETFHEAALIGRIIGKYQLGVSDAWLAQRVEKMIAHGKLEVVSKTSDEWLSYRQILRKV